MLPWPTSSFTLLWVPIALFLREGVWKMQPHCYVFCVCTGHVQAWGEKSTPSSNSVLFFRVYKSQIFLTWQDFKPDLASGQIASIMLCYKVEVHPWWWRGKFITSWISAHFSGAVAAEWGRYLTHGWFSVHEAGFPRLISQLRAEELMNWVYRKCLKMINSVPDGHKVECSNWNVESQLELHWGSWTISHLYRLIKRFFHIMFGMTFTERNSVC